MGIFWIFFFLEVLTGIFFGDNGIFFFDFWEFSLGVSMGDFGELWGGF